MRNINKLVLALVLSLAATSAFAGNDNGPTFFGDTTNNNQTYNQPTANGGTGYGGSATAVGQGGNASATGGSVGDIRNTNTAAGGSVLGSGNSANDNTNVNANTAFGGRGGDGGTGIGFGGSAHQGQAQGQQQGQGQSQSNIGVNGQSQSNVGINGQSSSTSTSTKTNQSQAATATNAGNSQTVGGQQTSVGGQSVTINEAEIPDDVTIRSAPAMVVTAPNATVSCYKTFGGSLSGILGAAGLSGGKIDQSCEFRETVRIAASVDREGAAKMLCLNDLYAIANADKCKGVRPVFITGGKAGRQIKANAK